MACAPTASGSSTACSTSFAGAPDAIERKAMQQDPETFDLEPLEAFVGTWTTEATHPLYPSMVVRGRSTFEWLEGKRFLIQRSVNEHPDFPDGLAVFGVTDEQLSMHYFDSRGVFRVYAVSLSEGTLTFSRDAPEFSQRFTSTISDDGNTITGLSKLSRDGSTWEDDLAITYRRAE
jgi:hypothetical protein